MIYTFCLYRGSISPHRRIVKPPSHRMISFGRRPWPQDDINDRPNLALLAVSQGVRAEALCIYLGKNLVIVTENAFDRFDPWQGAERVNTDFEAYCFTAERVPYIRQLQVGFSRFEISGETRELINAESTFFLTLSGSMVLGTQVDEREWHHESRRSYLELLWRHKANILSSSDLKLEQLILDFEECYCPDRCCRMFVFISQVRDLLPWVRDSPELVQIKGAEDEVEETMIRTMLEDAP